VAFHSTKVAAKALNTARCFCVSVNSLLNGLVNRNASKGIVIGQLDREGPICKLTFYFWVADLQDWTSVSSGYRA